VTLLLAEPHVFLTCFEQRFKIFAYKSARRERASCEHFQRLDSAPRILAHHEAKPLSRPCGASPHFTSLLLISTNIQKLHSKMFQIGSIRSGCLWKIWRGNYTVKTATLGHQYHTRMFLISPICTLTRRCPCRDLSPISEMRAEIRMKCGPSFLPRYREASEVIDLQALFNDYWSSDNHKFTILSQSLSLTRPRIADREGQRLLSLESIVDL
jgi:hypothetical protein